MPEAGQVGTLIAAQMHRDYTRFAVQRALAAFRAMALRLLAGSAAARAFPPLSPPFRPMLARYSLTVFVGPGACSSVDSRTTSAANWFASFGILLERLMHIP